MLLSFALSMPGVNSWNGKWTGADKFYARIRSVHDKARAEKLCGYYHYSFGDGWAAGVTVQEVNATEAKRIHRISKGFCGYDWMIDSIIHCSQIVRPQSICEESHP